MIRRLGECCPGCRSGLGECNAVESAAEWTMVTTPTLTPASSVPIVAPALVPPGGFDYTAAGITYGGQPVVSWAQLALGLLALRGSGT